MQKDNRVFCWCHGEPAIGHPCEDYKKGECNAPEQMVCRFKIKSKIGDKNEPK